jgi:hypothetical protein
MGDIDGDGIIDIMDALEILKFLAGIDNLIARDVGNALAASLITDASKARVPQAPDVMDALEILKLLAGIDSLVSHPTPPAE